MITWLRDTARGGGASPTTSCRLLATAPIGVTRLPLRAVGLALTWLKRGVDAAAAPVTQRALGALRVAVTAALIIAGAAPVLTGLIRGAAAIIKAPHAAAALKGQPDPRADLGIDAA